MEDELGGQMKPELRSKFLVAKGTKDAISSLANEWHAVVIPTYRNRYILVSRNRQHLMK